ncbi:MAG: hypothetical protein ACON5B_16975 [Myxococcota bacterium]
MTLLLLAGLSWAAEPPEVDLHGDLKAFTTATFPYDNAVVFGEDATPTGQSLLDARLKFRLKAGIVQVNVHHALTGITTGGAGLGIGSTGVVFGTPETLKLSWQAFDDDANFQLRGRTDRLFVKIGGPGVDVTLGRQPVSFGHGLFFTPLDLVNPFTPAVIDQEYKPGVDALRVDGFFGASGQLTFVAAYTGRDPLAIIADPRDADLQTGEVSAESTVIAGYGQGTVGVTDIGGFAGLVHQDLVLGATTTTSVGPVGLSADAAVTVPLGDTEEEPFFRGTVGVLGQASPTTMVTGEVYVQTLGTTDSSDLFNVLSSDRYVRGELWLTGVAYAGVSVQQEIVPTLNASLATMMNLTDPSAFVTPGLVWSVDNNAEVVAGCFIGVGKRPSATTTQDLIDSGENLLTTEGQARALGVQSEFGSYPTSAYVQLKAYF